MNAEDLKLLSNLTYQQLLRMGASADDIKPVFARQREIFVADIAKSPNACSNLERSAFVRELHTKFLAYEIYRMQKLTIIVKDPANWPKFDESKYLSNPDGLGVMALLGTSPIDGQICVGDGLKDVVQQFEAADLPPAIADAKLFNVVGKWRSQIKEVGTPYPDYRINEMMGSVNSPFRSADCSVLVDTKLRLVQLKHDIEKRFGYGVVIFDDVISQHAVDVAQAANHERLKKIYGKDY